MSGMYKSPPDTAIRNEAGERRFGSLDELRDFCRPIGQGWFRCQAFAIGGVNLPSDNDCVRACLEAESAAAMESDPYKQTACLAWPISSLVSRGCIDEASAMAARAVGATERVNPASSRADALVQLLQAAWPLGDAVRRTIFTGLFDLLASDPHWRVRRACVDAASFFASGDQPDWLHELVRACQDPKAVVKINQVWTAKSDFRPRIYVVRGDVLE